MHGRGRRRTPGAGTRARSRQALRRPRRRRRSRFRRATWGGFRVPRAERRRQDVDHAHDRMRIAAVERDAAHPRSRSRGERSRDPLTPRRRAAAGHTRLRADRARERDHLRPLLRPAPLRAAQARGRAAGVRPAERTRGFEGGTAVGRVEATVDDRPLARQRPRRPPPRRADDRSRSAGAPHGLGPSLPSQAARRDAHPDDALHGRSRAAL